MSELKPCPFCGKEVILLDVSIQPAPDDAKWDVYCRTHGCFLNSGTNNMFINREDAIIAWNTRAEPPELITLREQVKAQPACNNAIREYEEAQERRSKA